MHPELSEWLNEVWSRRDRLLESARARQEYSTDKLSKLVYQTYAQTLIKSQKARPGDIACYLGELANLENQLASAPVQQTSGPWKDFRMGEMADVYLGFGQAVLKVEVNTPLLPDEQAAFEAGMGVARSFIHYRHGRSRPCQERVYLNVKRPYRVFVLDAILRPLYRGPEELPGLVSAKLTGPIGDDRADTIVIYVADKPSGNEVVGRVRAFQGKGHTYCFSGEAPRITKRVPDLLGVSTGTEPPHDGMQMTNTGDIVVRHVGGQSFGSARSAMIAQAMVYVERHPAGFFSRDKTKFKNTVADLFRKAGIDPSAPEGQVYVPQPLTYGPLQANGLF